MGALTPPRIEKDVVLPDDRRLGVAEFGPVRGRPIVWLHGTPGGRRQIPELLRRVLHAEDVRLIVVERPGYGSSTPHAYDDVRGFTRDVEHLVDALGVDRLGVAALSGGGPYALAIAHELGERVNAVAVLGGVAPHVGSDAAPGGLVGLLSPLGGVAKALSGPLGRLLSGIVQVSSPVSSAVFDVSTRVFPPGDRRVFADPLMKAMFIDDLIRSARGGLPGPALDFRLFVRHWGFELGALEHPVYFWQGDADPIVTLEQARIMVGRVQRGELIVRPGESHLGGFALADDAVKAILSHW
ncbi:MAG: alpha/beta hydrolase [Acidimicrobiales bacterium]|nr:alpha/beta hydrolase [Acidimicrobiales bacterium]